ncbi:MULTISPECIES: tautomerase family protein [Nonomuraea]|uniref:4-oxalocrotonate tautomerase family protein n=1 Tax=Nonomuraea salmonea TaxID=46181 RepID=A0ABV5NW95_9ACTN
MPFITVLMLSGKDLDQRRRFAEEVTKSAEATLGARPEEVRVRFVEMTRSDFARAGRLMCDEV